jgi:hypothetical protein
VNKLLTKVHNHWPKYRIAALALLIGLSLGWIIYDWSDFSLLKERAQGVVALGVGLAVTEACFILGALFMAASVGIQIAESNRVHGWIRHMRYVRREVKTIAHQTGESRLFGVGFWLNFIGAVGTSTLLVAAVFYYLPVAGWWLLIALLADLVVTFGWRIPVHLARRKLIRMNKITVRQATPEDIDSYLKLQAERWNEDNMAQRAQLESRLRAYPQGMMVAERAGEIVGMVYAMRISNYNYKSSPSWNEITNNGFCDNADRNGDAIFGVDLSTAKGVGHLAGDKLLLAIGQLAITEGVRAALLGGRLPGYHHYADRMTAEQYLMAKNEKGKPLDRQVRFYTSVPGLKALKVLPNYFNDPESLDYGVLLRWKNPLYGLPGKRFWAWLLPILVRI